MRSFCLAALHLSVVFIQLNDASQACQHFKPSIVSQPSFFLWSSTVTACYPTSPLSHKQLHHYSSASPPKRAAGRSEWAFIADAVVCNGDAALVGCSMYTLSSPVGKMELTLWEADVRIMMSFQRAWLCVHALLTSPAEMNPQWTSFHYNLHLISQKKIKCYFHLKTRVLLSDQHSRSWFAWLPGFPHQCLDRVCEYTYTVYIIYI